MAEIAKQPEASGSGTKIAVITLVSLLAMTAAGVTYPEWGPQVVGFVQAAGGAAANFGQAVANIGPNTEYVFQQLGEHLAANATQLKLLLAGGAALIGLAASGYIGKEPE